MTWLRRRWLTVQIICATHLGAAGDAWAARAAARLRKLSGELPENSGGRA